MPDPKSKAQIVGRLVTERRRLERNLNSLSREDMVRPGVVGSWSAKDVVAHLADWEAHMLAWIQAARRGERVETPDTGLTWQDLDVFNQRVYEAHRDQPLDEVVAYFRETHDQFMAMVEAMPEDEIMAPGRYEFTGRAPVYEWLRAYALHDLWAKDEIRRWIKSGKTDEGGGSHEA